MILRKMNRDFDFLKGLVIVVIGLFAQQTIAEDFYTTNVSKLARFIAKANANSSPVTVLSFGDSMADSYRSVTFYTMRKLEDRLGASGYAFNNYRNKLLYNLSGSAAIVSPSAFWFTKHWRLMPGDGLWWQAETVPGGIYSDKASLFIVGHPGGGMLQVSISTNTGAWSELLVTNAYSPTPQGMVLEFSMAPNFYRLRADSLTGTNYIIAPRLFNSHSKGVVFAFMDEGGIALSTVTNVPRTIRDPIMNALNPDLIIWHMKEDGSTSTSNRMVECETWWKSAAPQADVLYIGTPWTAYDATNTLTMDQNRVVRSIALNEDRAYCDLMQPAISYDWLHTNALLADEVHLNNAGGQWGASVLWDDVGFFALRRPSTIAINFVGGIPTASFQTVTGITYSVEGSTNLSSWDLVNTIPGDGLTHLQPLGEGTNYMRLRLQPE